MLIRMRVRWQNSIPSSEKEDAKIYLKGVPCFLILNLDNACCNDKIKYIPDFVIKPETRIFSRSFASLILWDSGARWEQP